MKCRYSITNTLVSPPNVGSAHNDQGSMKHEQK